jgi:hypothetical protein
MGCSCLIQGMRTTPLSSLTSLIIYPPRPGLLPVISFMISSMLFPGGPAAKACNECCPTLNVYCGLDDVPTGFRIPSAAYGRGLTVIAPSAGMCLILLPASCALSHRAGRFTSFTSQALTAFVAQQTSYAIHC